VEQQKTKKQETRIFDNMGKPLPLYRLLNLQRKELYSTVRLMMPIWHFIPILAQIIAWFKRRNQKYVDPVTVPVRASSGNSRLATLQKYQRELLPAGYTLDQYLAHLEEQWPSLAGRQSRQDLKANIHSLVKDRARDLLRLQPLGKLTVQNFDDLATTITGSTPSLRQLGGKNSATLYVKLLLCKELPGIRV
jgi:hypothetical protein